MLCDKLMFSDVMKRCGKISDAVNMGADYGGSAWDCGGIGCGWCVCVA